MTSSNKSSPNEFKIVLTSLEDMNNDSSSSPIFLSDSLKNPEDSNLKIKREFRANCKIEVSHFLCPSQDISENTPLEDLLLSLSPQCTFNLISLTPEQVYVFKYMKDEVMGKFMLSKSTIHHAFSLF